jgi:hypothetical protein
MMSEDHQAACKREHVTLWRCRCARAHADGARWAAGSQLSQALHSPRCSTCRTCRGGASWHTAWRTCTRSPKHRHAITIWNRRPCSRQASQRGGMLTTSLQVAPSRWTFTQRQQGPATVGTHLVVSGKRAGVPVSVGVRVAICTAARSLSATPQQTAQRSALNVLATHPASQRTLQHVHLR